MLTQERKQREVGQCLSKALELLRQDAGGPLMDQKGAIAALEVCKLIREKLIGSVYTSQAFGSSSKLQQEQQQFQRDEQSLRDLLPGNSMTQPKLSPLLSRSKGSQSQTSLRSSQSAPQLSPLTLDSLAPAPMYGTVEQVLLHQLGLRAKKFRGQAWTSACFRRLGRRLRLRMVCLSQTWLSRTRQDLQVARSSNQYRQSRHSTYIAMHKVHMNKLGVPMRREEHRLSEEEAMAERIRVATEAAKKEEAQKRRARDLLAAETAMRLPRWYATGTVAAPSGGLLTRARPLGRIGPPPEAG